MLYPLSTFRRELDGHAASLERGEETTKIREYFGQTIRDLSEEFDHYVCPERPVLADIDETNEIDPSSLPSREELEAIILQCETIVRRLEVTSTQIHQIIWSLRRRAEIFPQGESK
jgi:hypothetical protein